MNPNTLDYSGAGGVSKRKARRLLIMAICAAVLVVAYNMLAPVLMWSGATRTQVTVRVKDATTGKPMPQATIQFLKGSGAPMGVTGTTDTEGIATLTVLLGAGGERGCIYESVGYGSEDRVILVQLSGYIDVTAAPGSGKTFRILGWGPKPKLSIDVPMMPQPPAPASSRAD